MTDLAENMCYLLSMQKTQELTESDYLVSSQVMEVLHISRRTLDRWVADGRLPYVQPGGVKGNRLYPSDAIESLLKKAA